MVLEKFVEKAVVKTAGMAWPVFQAVNQRFKGKLFQPKWAPAPLMRQKEKSFPTLGWPRETDSLCPRCVKETREKILNGEEDVNILINGHPGEIKAQIVEENGKILMRKTCPVHGVFEDVMAIDPEWLKRIERLYPGRDFKAVTDLHNHGTSSIQYGRGSVLTIDLTNRCNMMCDPCFMDANQVGYVHELSFDDVQKLLDDAVTVKPKRQLSVQFSGGEPTISPIFLDAVAYAKEVGFFSIQAATNGIRFAQEPGFAEKARDAGMRLAYLQFDGVGNENHAHRKIGNLFDVKLRAIENLYAAGIDVVLVVTIVNTINDHQVGPIIKFAMDNADKISFVAFQPVSFTGRDEDIDDETRQRQRYTLSHLAHDVKKQTGATEPLRDWFPISAAGPVSDVTDLLKGPNADWGTLKCGCHPNCGIATTFMVNKQTKKWAPISAFLNIEQFLNDAKTIVDAGRGPFWTKVQVALALLRNYDPNHVPEGFRLYDLIKKYDKQSGGALGGKMGATDNANRKQDEWLIMFVAGMWFQDLFNYDFRRTEMCIIPYATQMGEISFCAYNTGIGWRQIVEKMFMNATTVEWFKKYGRHPIFANKKDVPLPEYADPIALRVSPDANLLQIEPMSKNQTIEETAGVAAGGGGGGR
ncbi:MAG: radical SAM protein [candidate division Zixibacteria bacterium]|nr:radical SAM protein [candidate division Zixibacteria bacterium]